MAKKLKPFEKLITVMITGKPVTVQEIEATLGNEIHMYRLSTYIWHIKEFAGGEVKSIKDGRKVTAYQIVDIAPVKQYLQDQKIDVTSFVPGQAKKIVRATKNATKAAVTKPAVAKKVKPVKQISDLKAKPQKKVKTKKTEKEVSVPASQVKDEIEVLEITEDFDSELNDIVDDIRSNIND